MLKKFLIFKVVAFLVIAVVFVTVIIIHSVITEDIQTKMFNNIEEFSKLEAYEIGDIDADVVKPPMFSEYEFVDSYERKVLYENQEYNVCAYVFNNAIDCYGYYDYIVNLGTTEEIDVWDYCLSIDDKNADEPYCDFIIYSGDRLYYIVGSDKESLVQFLNWLNADFKIILE